MLPFCVMVLKFSKKVRFLQFYADLSKKLKSVRIIHMYASKNSHRTHPENDMVYMVYSNENIKKKNADSAEI